MNPIIHFHPMAIPWPSRQVTSALPRLPDRLPGDPVRGWRWSQMGKVGLTVTSVWAKTRIYMDIYGQDSQDIYIWIGLWNNI